MAEACKIEVTAKAGDTSNALQHLQFMIIKHDNSARGNILQTGTWEKYTPGAVSLRPSDGVILQCEEDFNGAKAFSGKELQTRYCDNAARSEDGMIKYLNVECAKMTEEE